MDFTLRFVLVGHRVLVDLINHALVHCQKELIFSLAKHRVRGRVLRVLVHFGTLFAECIAVQILDGLSDIEFLLGSVEKLPLVLRYNTDFRQSSALCFLLNCLLLKLLLEHLGTYRLCHSCLKLLKIKLSARLI